MMFEQRNHNFKNFENLAFNMEIPIYNGFRWARCTGGRDRPGLTYSNTIISGLYITQDGSFLGEVFAVLEQDLEDYISPPQRFEDSHDYQQP